MTYWGMGHPLLLNHDNTFMNAIEILLYFSGGGGHHLAVLMT